MDKTDFIFPTKENRDKVKNFFTQLPIKSIFVSFRWTPAFLGFDHNIRLIAHPGAMFIGFDENNNRITNTFQAFENSIKELMEIYKKNNPDVYFLSPIPEFPWRVPDRAQALVRTLSGSNSHIIEQLRQNISITKQSYFDYNKESFEELDKLKKQYNFSYIDLTSKLCDDERCYGIAKDGQAFYYDDDHLNKHIINEFFRDELMPVIQSGK